MSKLKKTLLISAAAIIIIPVAVILIISPVTKWAVQKYDEQYTGRQITLDRAYVNPFTGYIRFRNIKIHELESDSVFFSANSISVNFAMLKLLSKTYEISEFTLNHPRGTIVQNKMDFNFNDLVEKFSPEENTDTTQAPVRFNILNIKIAEGEFYYREELIPINYFIKNVNFESTGKRWDADTVAGQFSFTQGPGSGDIKGDFTVNLKTLEYRAAVVVEKFDMHLIQQYLNDLANYGTISASVDADIKATGNINDQENLTASGLITINDFHFGKNPEDDYSSFDKLVLAIQEASPKNHQYFIDSISLSQPYFKYERYDYLDNLQTMFGKKGANIEAAKADTTKFNLIIEIADYVEVIVKNFLQSYYKIDRLAVYQGGIQFNDYSISEKFAVEINPLTVIADSIDRNHDRINVSLNTPIKPYGNISAELSINPKDSSDFDLQFHLQKLPAALFNPYTITYTSFPFDRGTIEFTSTWKVRNGNIQSDNHLVIIDPRLTKRLSNEDTKWIPVPLIMAFIRERGNVIDYEIPITGNLKDPNFHLRDAIFDLLGNVFVKPPTTPYRMMVKNTETKIEKFLTLKWEMRQSTILPIQEKFIERMADFLAETPEASVTVYPQHYMLKEKEYILLFEAMKKYFLAANNKDAKSFSEEDAEKVDKMSVKDSLFVRYLNKQVNESLIFTIQEKCAMLIDSAVINAELRQLKKEREDAFINYFKERKVESRVKISVSENVIPYNGFSFYKIEYKGEFPESLIKAYRQMNELNEEAPREKYKKQRKENLNAGKETVVAPR